MVTFIVVLFLVLPKLIPVLVGIGVAVTVVLNGYRAMFGREEADRNAGKFNLDLIAARRGDADAMNKVGVRYLKGDGVEQDYAKADAYIGDAIKKGCGPAARNRAAMYRDGLGKPRNLQLAVHWYQRAEAMGDAGAEDDLAEMLIKAQSGAEEEEARRQDEARRRDEQQREETVRRQEEARRSQERARQEERRREAESSSAMTRSAALEILDLKEGASREQVEAAYKRMMLHNHPDRPNGSNFFAKQLNLARETLLGKK